MYLGRSPLLIDRDTVLYILRQKDSMPEGNRWGDTFPAVVNHTSSGMARRHPDFHAAKHGDYEAALRLVDAFVKDSKIADIAQRYPHAHVVYNHKMQGGDINMIPAAYAAKFSAIGMTVDHDIIAVTDVSHTPPTPPISAASASACGLRVRSGKAWTISSWTTSSPPGQSGATFVDKAEHAHPLHNGDYPPNLG